MKKKILDFITRGRNNIKNFGWKKCADETLEIYKNIL